MTRFFNPWTGLWLGMTALAALFPTLFEHLGLLSDHMPEMRGPRWGFFSGIATYALINAVAPLSEEEMRKTPTETRLAFLVALVLLSGTVLFFWYQSDLRNGLSGADLNPNPVFLGMLVGLMVVLPTKVQGYMQPVGDERFRANQQTAQTRGFRALIGLVILWAMLEQVFGFAWPPVLVAVFGLTLVSTYYTVTLWVLERRA